MDHLWTFSGRKQGTGSSSNSSTITIPNFRALSLAVLEFWKRYHQKSEMQWNSGDVWRLKKFSAAEEQMIAKFSSLVWLHRNLAVAQIIAVSPNQRYEKTCLAALIKQVIFEHSPRHHSIIIILIDDLH